MKRMQKWEAERHAREATIMERANLPQQVFEASWAQG